MQALRTPARILVAEDQPEARGYLDVALRCQGYSVEFAGDGAETLRLLNEPGSQFSLLLMDMMMPKLDGLETLRQVRQFDTALPIIILSGVSSPSTVVDAVKSGANDFLAKPVSYEDLGKALQKALRISGDQPQRPTRTEAAAGFSETPALGVGPWAKEIELFVRQIGSSEVPVLLQGETGVGKEVLARLLHSHSPRTNRPFLKLNCAALSSELAERELFGYERGAFRSSPGKFEMADGGTILLDEIGDLDLKLQARLLQVLQDSEFTRVGSRETCRVNARVVASTRRDLEQTIREGRFREDLYYRLNIISIQIPPLRERKEEILPLAQYFVRKHATPEFPPVEVTADLKEALMAYEWPGNIRELENAIRRLLVFKRSSILAEELARAGRRRREFSAGGTPSPLATGRKALPSPAHHQEKLLPDSGSSGAISILKQVNEASRHAETDAILRALNSTQWNRKKAAVRLNIDYKALLYRMKKLGIGRNKA